MGMSHLVRATPVDQPGDAVCSPSALASSQRPCRATSRVFRDVHDARSVYQLSIGHISGLGPFRCAEELVDIEGVADISNPQQSSFYGQPLNQRRVGSIRFRSVSLPRYGFGHTPVQWLQPALGATDESRCRKMECNATEPDPQAGSCKTGRRRSARRPFS